MGPDAIRARAVRASALPGSGLGGAGQHRANTLLTDLAYQAPPRDVLMPRALRASAIWWRDVAPARCYLRMAAIREPHTACCRFHFDLAQKRLPLIAVDCAMATVIYRCPTTGLKVQGWSADDPAANAGETYEATTCPVCRLVHLVNPRTGKVLAVDESDPSR
jgi:hypothetical protein